jgi:hypothetical protein
MDQNLNESKSIFTPVPDGRRRMEDIMFCIVVRNRHGNLALGEAMQMNRNCG